MEAWMDSPTEAVREIALWLHANAEQATLGASAPFILGIALGKPPTRRIASLEQLEADRQTWRWWVDRAASTQEFCKALREKAGVELEIAGVLASKYS
jgi:hypothetical protein